MSRKRIAQRVYAAKQLERKNLIDFEVVAKFNGLSMIEIVPICRLKNAAQVTKTNLCPPTFIPSARSTSP